MGADIIDFTEIRKQDELHLVHEVMCVPCVYRWQAVAPQDLALKDYVCPQCERSGGVISTGQIILDADIDEEEDD